MRNKMCWIFPCFAVVLLFGGCQRDDSVAQPLALYDCLGEAEAEVVEAFQLDGESWTREENSDSIEYFTENGAELCGYPAWMQVVFEEGTLSGISCYVNIEGATEEEIAEAILALYDSCVEKLGEPGYAGTEYPGVEMDWTVYGEGEEFINNLPISQTYGACSLWSIWGEFDETFPYMTVDITARCTPPQIWDGKGYLEIKIDRDSRRSLIG